MMTLVFYKSGFGMFNQHLLQQIPAGVTQRGSLNLSSCWEQHIFALQLGPELLRLGWHKVK